ncbi:Rei1p NDAI_0B04780 [Naumovozyma dairenensis CBS 421]|uniref:C2H2-type domain-containing protein n=1 Tax=Naumovozyma dairenensis (strain ATCC 10597 / BCRC 20456 / CBS 421 / NBRC 0211 / NRRL Y-12639) TaxID=1071378 RepID=G0W6V1_NAUDC|nr:hypothetical protein NDAI_0B04780 [Naumovozyma dairenensis CBS 421]CCD23512.1 hypothetical protein NDAI_0B04780 [Naumovozyma dairenensis CBS 421]
MSGIYTCNSCVMEFASSIEQRQHMKSDWHRYNLKRRVAQLPPITESTFNTKVNAANTAATAETTKNNEDSKKQLTKKEIRRREKEALLQRKKELLELARENMLKNMQQQQQQEQPITPQQQEEIPLVSEKQEQEQNQEQNQEQKSQVEAEQKQDNEEDLTEEQLAERLMNQKLANKVDIPLEQCLFCTKRIFTDFETNLDHMFKSHGFYIPEQKYLEDKEGLVKYLSEKIGLGNVCIVCNYQGKSIEAVRAHMLAKRHCKIPYENENEKLEISEFYNFTSTYDQFEKPARKKKTVIQINSGDNLEGEGEDEWEDVDSAEDDANGNGEIEEELYEDDEDEPPKEYLYHDNVELHLPTGIKVGHRSLQRYYKQDLKPEKELTEGQGTLMAAETRSFVNTLDAKEIQVRQRTWQTEIKDKKTHDKRRAKFVNNQPYYRDQLLQ